MKFNEKYKKLKKINNLTKTPNKMQKLDDVDRKILDILIDNTRTPFTI